MPQPGVEFPQRWNPFAGTSALYQRGWIVYLILALAAAGWISLRGDSLGVALTPASQPTVGWGRDLGVGLALAVVAVLMWEGVRRLPSASELERQLGRTLTGVSRSEAIALAALSGFAEELFFRGAVQPVAGLWVTAALFGLLHLKPGAGCLLWMSWAFAMGLALGAMASWTSSLVAPITAHVAVNAAGLWRLTGDAVRGGSVPGDEVE